MQDLLLSPRFPRSSKYHPEWIKAAVSGGANPLWLTEWLTEKLNLKPGMRVLDLGCGRGMSSIFLHNEFQVQVWAVDMMISPSENLDRVRDAGMIDHIFPLQADARHLPFAAEFFDAIISIDSFFYYGTDDLFLSSILRYLKPKGVLAIAGAGLMQEIQTLPVQLKQWWTTDLWCLHSAEWWRQHWQRTDLVDVVTADVMEEGWKFWLNWHHTIAPDNATEIDALNADSGEYLGYVRAIAVKREGVLIEEPITSIPYQYIKVPMLRGD
jgi:SAM-dependent methyltransferase